MLGIRSIHSRLGRPEGRAKGWAAGGQVAGVVGSTVAALAAGSARVPDLPDFGRVGYIAVSADDVALVKTKFGWKMTPTSEVLARASRSELASVELDEGKMVSHLTLRFGSGQLWEFDVPCSDKKTARAVVEALNRAPE